MKPIRIAAKVIVTDEDRKALNIGHLAKAIKSGSCGGPRPQGQLLLLSPRIPAYPCPRLPISASSALNFAVPPGRRLI